MKHGSLFSGIGGFDLASQWMGWENIFHCEWNEFGQKVLKHYWPLAISYNDITKTDFTIHRGAIDILTGGFPCQPYSVAGKRLGKEDERHLWPHMLRAIQEIQPTWVVGENVRGLVSWNGGMVFDEVQSDLETKGYEVIPFILPAAGVNAPHRRDRIWFIAYSENFRRRRLPNESGEERTYGSNELFGKQSTVQGRNGAVTNPTTERIQGSWTDWQQKSQPHAEQKLPMRSHTRTDWENWPVSPPLCVGNDGLPTQLDGITVSKWRNESIKAAGNAIVPQVALQIFKAIEQFQNSL